MPKPLTGLAGWVDPHPEATAAQRSGGIADPRHGVVGKGGPYAYEGRHPGEMHGPYGTDDDLLGFDFSVHVMPAGRVGQDPTATLQPKTHAAPWPKGMPMAVTPDGTEHWRNQENRIHASDTGGARAAEFTPSTNPKQDDWIELLDTTPGVQATAGQDPNVPDQLKGASPTGWGNRDRIQSFAKQNQYGFDSAHMHRRYAAVGSGAFPGNYMWMRPGGRPMVKSTPGTGIIPTGVDSPFHGQDAGQPYDTQGAVLQVLPAAYTPPPDPQLAASYPMEEAPTVDLY